MVNPNYSNVKLRIIYDNNMALYLTEFNPIKLSDVNLIFHARIGDFVIYENELHKIAKIFDSKDENNLLILPKYCKPYLVDANNCYRFVGSTRKPLNLYHITKEDLSIIRLRKFVFVKYELVKCGNKVEHITLTGVPGDWYQCEYCNNKQKNRHSCLYGHYIPLLTGKKLQMKFVVKENVAESVTA